MGFFKYPQYYLTFPSPFHLFFFHILQWQLQIFPCPNFENVSHLPYFNRLFLASLTIICILSI